MWTGEGQGRAARLGTVWRDRVRPDGPWGEQTSRGWRAVTLTVWTGLAAGQPARVAWRAGRVETWRPAGYRWPAGGPVPRLTADALAASLLRGLLDERERCLDAWDQQQAALESRLASNPPVEVRDGALALRHRLLTARHWLEADRRAARRSGRGDGAAGPVEVACHDRVAAQHLRVDSLRELAAGVLDAYFSGVSARLNEIVKTLTVVTTVMLPASLVAALYGMNFRHLPGAGSPFGFWIVVGVVGALAVSLLAVFRRRRWI
ncbi:MAG: hypothetical protein M0Z54_02005 [Thermaerobacter sp.]|nr:hypothetical protein [Thermaerobacter sp.]